MKTAVSSDIETDITLLSKQLIAIKSVANAFDAQEQCLKILAEAFSERFIATNYIFNGQQSMVLSNTNEKVVDFIISGHVDVVEGDDNVFTPSIKNGRLYGRGAYDMKAELIASIFGADDYIKNGGTKTIAILITTDEEVGGFNGTKQLLEVAGYRAKFAFASDGGNDHSIVIKQKGVLQLHLQITGKSAHAAYPWEGDCVLSKAIEIQNLIHRSIQQPTIDDQWHTSATLTRIDTTNSFNQIPGIAKACYDVRYIDEEHLNLIKKIIKSELGEKTKIIYGIDHPILDTKPDNLYVKLLQDCLSKTINQQINIIHENGSSDAVFFSAHDIPAALFRPLGGGAHQDDEWVDIKSLDDMRKTIQLFISKF